MRSVREAALVALSLSLTLVIAVGSATAAESRFPSNSKSTFRLQPSKDRVLVTSKVTLANRAPDSVTVGPCPNDRSRTCRITTRWYVDEYPDYWIAAGARKVKFKGPGVKARITSQEGGWTYYTVRFAPIYRGQKRTFTVSYEMPAARPRSPNQTRILDAYAHFC